MTTAAWVYLGVGFFVGLGCAVVNERYMEDSMHPGIAWLWCWLAWPLIGGILAFLGAVAVLGRVVRLVERKTPRRVTREELEARVAARDRRIAELEAETGIGEAA